MKKIIRNIIIMLLVFYAFSLTTIAAVPYESYTYTYTNGEAKAVSTPPPYIPTHVIDSKDMGVDLKKPSDFSRDKAGNWYIVDTDSNSVIKLDKNYNLIISVSQFNNGGKIDTFNKPEGIYVFEDGSYCVADTNNQRLVVLSTENNLLKVINKPQNNLVDQKAAYLPIKVSCDSDKQFYVIARNNFSGILQFDNNGNFIGYIGSNVVSFNPIDLLWKNIMSKAQKDKMVKFVPVEYSNITIDNSGFIYAVSSSATEEIPLKRLNPSGKDVLIRNGYDSKIVGDIHIRSTFVDIAIDESGIYSALDSKKGRIFTYDADGYLLFAFGNLEAQDGCFIEPVAIEKYDNKIYVLDAGKKSITEFQTTEFSALVYKGLIEYNTGHYKNSMDTWESVLTYNSNYDLAYAQIGKSLLRLGKYQEALHYFKLGNFRGDKVIMESGYNKAFSQYSKQFMMKNWGIIVSIIVVLFLLTYFSRKMIKKYFKKALVKISNTKVIKNIKFAFHILIHPFDGFWDMKRENKGSIFTVFCILFLVFVTNIITKQATGFLFNPSMYTAVNLFEEIRNVAILVILFTVANWSITTLMGGEGKIRDIFMVVGYSCLPIVIIQIPLAVCSNFLTYSDASYIQIFQVVSLIWVAMLLFFGILTIHQYSASKNIMTFILTIVSMMILVFVSMVFINLITQMVGFITAIFKEIKIRV